MKSSIFILAFVLISNAVLSQKISDMLENTLGAVVTVGVYKTDFAKKTLGFRGESYASREAYAKALDLSGAKSSGSGFIVAKNGSKYVITNAHVIENASSDTGSIYVFTVSQKKYEVKVLGGDSFYDFAVLEFVNPPGPETSSLRFSEDVPRIGEKVYAVGNPLGEYPYSVTDGIISAKNRVRDGMTGKFGFIQTTATVIWGNSGGPLINEKGQVAGINSQIAFADLPGDGSLWQSQINFALESSISARLLDDIVTTKGGVRRAYFGLVLSQKRKLNNEESEVDTSQVNKMPVIEGALRNAPDFQIIEKIRGAVIVSVNSVKVRNLEEIMGEFETVIPGSDVSIRINLNGKEDNLIIKSRLLSVVDHEQIATDFIRRVGIFLIDRDHPQVVLTQKEDKGFFLREKLSELKQIKETKFYDAAGNKKFIVLAAGIYNEASGKLWKTENLREFGSAIRITSLSGVVDLCLMPFTSQNLDDIKFTRCYISDQEEILKSVLYY